MAKTFIVVVQDPQNPDTQELEFVSAANQAEAAANSKARGKKGTSSNSQTRRILQTLEA